MNPNHSNYEKYFRRPLAWLLSFGMIASYVPASSALEQDTGEKDARNYYEDTPVSTATLNESIPLVGGDDAPAIIDTSSYYSLNLGTYADGRDYSLYLAEVNLIIEPDDSNVTVRDNNNDALLFDSYTLDIVYTNKSNDIQFSSFADVKTYLSTAGNSVLVSITATPTQGSSLETTLEASFTWTSQPNPDIEIGNVTTLNGDESETTTEGGFVYIEESNVSTLDTPKYSVYLAASDTAIYDTRIYETTFKYSYKDADNEDAEVILEDVNAAKSYLETVGNQVDITISVVLGTHPDETTASFSFTWETIHDEGYSIYPYITLPTGYEGNTILVDAPTVQGLQEPEYIAYGTGNIPLTATITYKASDGNTTLSSLADVKNYLDTKGKSVTVTYSVYDSYLEEYAEAWFIWERTDSVTVNTAVTGNGTITVINSLTGTTMISGLKTESFTVPNGTNVTFVFVPDTNKHQLKNATVDGVILENLVYSHHKTITNTCSITAEFGDATSISITLDYGYYKDDGNYHSEIISIKDDGTVSTLTDATRPGYVFLGWYRDDGSLATTSTKFYTGETLYAKWEVGTYKVTFVLTEGSFPEGVETRTVVFNGEYYEACDLYTDGTTWALDNDSLKNLIPVGSENHFIGWYTTDNTSVTFSTDFKEDTWVFSIWSKKYTITLDYNNATSDGQKYYYTQSNSTLLALPSPTREGYIFYGWWDELGTDVTGTTNVGWGTQVIDATTAAADDTLTATVFSENTKKELYARWIAGYGTVFFDFNYDNKKESYTLTSTDKLSDADYNILKTPEREGYDFVNWYRDEAIPTVVANNSFSHGETVYAVWNIINYNVSLDLNYGVTPDVLLYTTGDKHLLSDEALNLTPEREGYEFDHWNTAADGSGDKVPITNSFLENTYLYAIWDALTETIHLNPTEGSFGFTDITQVRIDPDDRTIMDYTTFINLNKPTRTGYTFSHWEDANGSTVSEFTIFQNGDTIYARWTPQEFTLDFKLNGGMVDGFTNDYYNVPDMTVTYDAAIGALTTLKKENATFAGWYLEDSFGNLAVDDSGQYIQLTEDTIWTYLENRTAIAKYSHPVTATIDGTGSLSTDHGSLDANHQVDVFEGDDIVFTIKADTGYRLKDIYVDGNKVNLSNNANYDAVNNTYTLSSVTKETTVYFELEMVPIYKVSISSGDEPLTNGTFTTSSETKENVVYVTEGDNVSITFKPDEWHRITSITANGTEIQFSNSSSFTYTVTVMEDIDLVVIFEELPKHTITATSGENGTITASYAYLGELLNNQMEIYEGETEVFMFLPSVGYMVSQVTVTDSEGAKDVTIYVVDNCFYMVNVTEDMAIHVTFEEGTEESEAIIVTLDANGGTLTSSGKLTTNSNDRLDSMPSDPVREGYIFTGWWNATSGGTQINTSYTFTEHTTIYAQWTQDLDGVNYTLIFDSNGGTSISSQLVSANSLALKPTDPTRSGYTFAGWYSTSLFTTAWDFSEDTVTKDMILYAKWTLGSTDSSTSVSRVVDHNGNPVSGATVSLMRNGSTYYSSITDDDGYYAFSLLAAGIYNLVVTTGDGLIHTTAVTIYNSSTTLPLVKLPEYSISSSVTIANGSLAQVVGGIDTLANLVAAKTSSFSKILVDIDISSYSSTSNQSTINNGKQSTDVIASYFDVDVTKTVTYTTGSTYTETITDADSLVEIIINIPAVYQGKDSYSIYRIHNGSVDRITTTYNNNSERIIVSADGTRMSIFVNKFSTFALAYSDASSATTEHDVKVTSYLNGVESTSTSIGSVAVSSTSAPEGDVVTVTPYPNFGFTLDNVVVKTDSGKYLTVTSNSNGSYSFAQSTSGANVSVYFNTTLNSGSNSLTDSNLGVPLISYFTDVSVSDPFCAAINEVVSLGLMTGTGNGTFSPHDSITRGMIVAILQYMSGEKSSLAPGFSDVYSTDYYYYAVSWAVSSGIVVGYEDNTFRPDQAITREELAAILYSYSRKYGSYDVLWYFPLSFADSESIIFWAKDAVTWCVNRDVLSARYNNFFLPQGISTRAEAAVAVVALLHSQK